MATPHERLYLVASALLDATEDSLTDAGRDVPDRQYVHAGAIAWDCDSLIVEVANLSHGLPGQQITEAIQCAIPRTEEMGIWLLRCSPTLSSSAQAPSAAALDAWSEGILTDAFVVMRGILERRGDFLPDECTLMGIGPLTFNEPQGAIGGFRLTVSVQV